MKSAWVYVALTAVTCAFHVAMALGAPWGHLTMGGQWPGVLPVQARMIAGVNVLVLTALACIVLTRAGALRLRLPSWTIWIVIAFLAVGVLAHIITPSAAERLLWLPVIVVMLGAALTVAIGP